MGSFSSKIRISRDGEDHRKLSQVEVNSSGTEENSTAQHNETASEENSEIASRNLEQHPPPKVRQSFSWLVDTPVVLTTTGKEQKAKGKRCVEGKEKTSCMLKYTNEKYLRSCQHLSEIPPSSSSAKQSKYSTSEDARESGKAISKGDLKANQGGPGPVERRDVVPSTSGFRVGFGADGKQVSHSSTSKSQAIM